MAAGESGNVEIVEVLALLREATRLIRDGAGGATVAERAAYQARKADLLARVAACDRGVDQLVTAAGQGESGGER